MKKYSKIIAYCKPYSGYIIPYFFYTIFYSIFGVFNYAMLIPLLNTLFGKTNTTLKPILTLPNFEISVNYIKLYFQYLIEKLTFQNSPQTALMIMCSVIVFSVLMSNIFKYLSILNVNFFKAHLVKSLRNKLFEKYNSLDMGYFSDKRKGDLMTKSMSDIVEVENALSQLLSAFFSNPIILIMYFGALFTISSSLTFFTLIIIPVSGGIIAILVKKIKKKSAELLDELGTLNSILEEGISYVKITNAFNAQKYLVSKFVTQNEKYNKMYEKMIARNELSSPFSEFSGILIICFIILYGGSLVLGKDSSLTASAFIAYITIFSQIIKPAKEISNTFISSQRSLAAAERILEILETKSKIADIPNPKILTEFQSEIEFRNLSFAYERKNVLKKINFTIKKGQTFALVGTSGGGKSTLADLIPRFYDPTDGEIRIDGINLKDISVFSLRNQIGIVTQEALLFNDSIYNNIVFGMENVSKTDVENAAKVANAFDFISKTENGFDTFIGDRGVKLSGGQKQRISIARAILRNPAILILDEATSALDTESEKLVQDALENLMKHRTCIVIAHRLSTIKNADTILVIKDGQIIEQGTHRELSLIKDGIYQKLSQMQNTKSLEI
ncbi:MAG: ABC transporter ATP-binding protein [Bacteroidetes bacterium]|nr:MAG: ABC transporter ATP-binding protein [Bacteroidota bacterium]